MTDRFMITYCQPAEPFDHQIVTAAIIAINGQRYPVMVNRAQDRWIILFGSHHDDSSFVSFQGALAAAHFNAYLYATDLVNLHLHSPTNRS